MALGTLTPQVANHLGTTDPAVFGDLRNSITNVVGEASYTTGGVSITAQQLGFSSAVLSADVQIFSSAGGANATGAIATAVVQPGFGSIKLKVFVTASTSPVQIAEAAGAANLSGITYQIQAQGY